ncbi:MAG: type II secretion system protein [Deltaproteobacteria bacterium]|nr:type II secretion system protein [Deltaproteobacteria bacterium]
MNANSLFIKQKGFTLIEIIAVLMILKVYWMLLFHINSLILKLLQDIESLIQLYSNLTEGKV